MPFGAKLTLYGTAAARPTAGVVGRLFYATDTQEFSRDDGTQWYACTITAEAEAGPHTHPQSDIDGLVADLAGKAATAHTHTFPGGAGPVVLQHPRWAASSAATNLALNAWNAVNDPNFRQMVDLRGYTKVRVQGMIGGTLVAATKIRVQYHTGGNPAVASGDAGWAELATTAGSHAVNTMFYSAEIAVPAGAQVNNVLLRCGLFSGDGAADPTLTCCILNFYT